MPESLRICLWSGVAALAILTSNNVSLTFSPATYLVGAITLSSIVSQMFYKSLSAKGASHEHPYLFDSVDCVRWRRAERHEYTGSRSGTGIERKP